MAHGGNRVCRGGCERLRDQHPGRASPDLLSPARRQAASGAAQRHPDRTAADGAAAAAAPLKSARADPKTDHAGDRVAAPSNPRPPMSSTVAVDALRVGMYIHLDGGWLSHPFPLSSFRISSPEQIATLRGLALTQVRWSPERSDPPPAVAGRRCRAVRRPARPTLRRDARRCANGRRRSRRRRRRAPRRRWPLRAGGCSRAARIAAALRTPACRGGGGLARRRRSASTPTRWKPAAARPALAQAMLDKMLDGTRDGAAADRRRQRPRGVARAERRGHRAADRPHRFGWPTTRCSTSASARCCTTSASSRWPSGCATSTSDFDAAEIAAWREHVARGVAQGQRMGLSRRRAGGDRPAPRTRRRQRLPAAADGRPDDARRAHRRASSTATTTCATRRRAPRR